MSSVEHSVAAGPTQTFSTSHSLARRDGELLIALVIQHSGGSEIAVLRPQTPLVIGRAPAQGLRINDTTLSREHARFELVAGRIIVDDLRSKNGVLVNGQRITRAELGVGTGVVLGAVCVSLQAVGRAGQELGIDSHDRLRRRAEEERAPHEAWLLGRDREPASDSEVVVGSHMRALLGDVERVAASRIPVVLHGETGTGKEVLARLLHEQGPRKARPMVRVNCAAIPKDLVESTLFGHERGAFTGALQQKKGVFEEADGGTVFLDEIGELPLQAQAVLLRVLETGSFSRVGAAREVEVDVRIVTATHRDLEAMSLVGTFRADLYYRLAGVTIEIAPLRDRMDELEALALRFLRLANEANGRAVQGIATDALAVLRAYAWPGNVRELRNAIERAVVTTSGPLIGAGDLPVRVRQARRARPPAASSALARCEPPAAPRAVGSGPLRGAVRQYEEDQLRATLEAAGWNRSVAAQHLELPVRTLSYRMKVLGLKKPGE